MPGWPETRYNADGTRWTLSAQGDLPVAVQSAPDRPGLGTLALLDFPWTLTTVDMLGQTVLEERPAFGGGVIAVSNV